LKIPIDKQDPEEKGLSAIIELLGYQRTAAGTGSVAFPVSESSTAVEALKHVSALFPALCLDPENVIVTVNGKAAPADRILKAGDIVTFLPVIGGG
jgi:sulfur carrier protein ThiS